MSEISVPAAAPAVPAAPVVPAAVERAPYGTLEKEMLLLRDSPHLTAPNPLDELIDSSRTLGMAASQARESAHSYGAALANKESGYPHLRTSDAHARIAVARLEAADATIRRTLGASAPEASAVQSVLEDARVLRAELHAAIEKTDQQAASGAARIKALENIDTGTIVRVGRRAYPTELGAKYTDRAVELIKEARSATSTAAAAASLEEAERQVQIIAANGRYGGYHREPLGAITSNLVEHRRALLAEPEAPTLGPRGLDEGWRIRMQAVDEASTAAARSIDAVPGVALRMSELEPVVVAQRAGRGVSKLRVAALVGTSSSLGAAVTGALHLIF